VDHVEKATWACWARVQALRTKRTPARSLAQLEYFAWSVSACSARRTASSEHTCLRCRFHSCCSATLRRGILILLHLQSRQEPAGSGNLSLLLLAIGAQRLCTKSPYSGISLCNLCVLCVSVVWLYSEFINHRDTEDTEVAQRRARSRLFVQSRAQTNACATLRNNVVAENVKWCRGRESNQLGTY